MRGVRGGDQPRRPGGYAKSAERSTKVRCIRCGDGAKEPVVPESPSVDEGGSGREGVGD